MIVWIIILALATYCKNIKSSRIDEHHQNVEFTEFHSDMYDWLCLLSNPKEKCVFVNWPRRNQEIFFQRKTNFVFFISETKSLKNFNTHSFYNTMRYFDSLGCFIIVITMDSLPKNNDLIEVFKNSVYFYSYILKEYIPTIPIKDKVCVPQSISIPVESLDENPIIHHNLESIELKELQIIANQKFNFEIDRSLNRKDLILVYDQCDKREDCGTHNYDIKPNEDFNSFNVLFTLSKFLVPFDRTKIQSVENTKQSWYAMFFKYPAYFADAVIILVTPDGHNYYSETEIVKKLETFTDYDTIVINVYRSSLKLFPFEICKHFIDNKSKFKISMYIFSNIIKDCMLIGTIYESSTSEIINKFDNDVLHFLNRVRYFKHAVIENRNKMPCLNYMGECLGLFKDLALQKFYKNEFKSHHRTYYVHKRPIVVKVFYQTWNPKSLHVLQLYEKLFNISRSTDMMLLVRHDLCDIQLIYIDCHQMNKYCNEEKITKYPTIKVYYREQKDEAYLFKGDPENPKSIVKFIINNIGNPMLLSQFDERYKNVVDVISSYYEIMILLKKSIDDQTKTIHYGKLITKATNSDAFVLIVDTDNYENILSKLEINTDEFKVDVAIWVNIKLKLKILIPLHNDELSMNKHYRWLDKLMMREVEYNRVLNLKKNNWPILLIFFYKFDYNLKNIINRFQKNPTVNISLNSVQLWNNAPKLMLYNKYNCKNLPCFGVFDQNNSLYVFEKNPTDYSSLIESVKSILNGTTKPIEPIKREPTLEFCSDFNHVKEYINDKDLYYEMKAMDQLNEENFLRENVYKDSNY